MRGASPPRPALGSPRPPVHPRLRGNDVGEGGRVDTATSRQPARLWRVALALLVAGVGAGCSGASAQRPAPEAQTAQRSPEAARPASGVEAHIDGLLARMTVLEKAGQMTQLNYQLVNPAGGFSSPEVALDEGRLRAVLSECPVGSFLNGSGVPAEDYVRFIGRLQEVNREATRLGVPFLYGIDHTHGAQYLAGGTIFPQPLNVAATFDTTHAWKMGWATAREAAPLGHNWTFAPVQDLAPDVRWPRLWETWGEDPLLASLMGVAHTRGVEGTRVGPYAMAATAKHYVGYGDPRTGWDRTPAHIPRQALWEFHLPPFQAVIDAGIAAVMVNSGEVNGEPAHASGELLTEILRQRLGFEGVILTDWGDVRKLVDMHRVAESEREAARLAVEAGIDMSMTAMSTRFCTDLVDLVEAGELSEARLDASVRRILRMKHGLGLFSGAADPTMAHADLIGAPEHTEAAREAAAASLVLLKNDTLAGGPALPLAPQARVLVAGPFADVRAPLAGGWTYNWQGAREDQVPAEVPSVAAALRQRLGPGVTVADSALAPEAFAAQAARADAVVLVLGEATPTEFVGNAVDLVLPPGQRRLASLAAASGAPVVLVVVGGRPLAMTPEIEGAAAVVWAGFPGWEGAGAIADLLTGAAAPGGRLPFSWPRGPSTSLPYNHKPSALFHLRDSAVLANDPSARAGEHPTLYPFGHGLRFGRVETGGLALSDTLLGAGGSLVATATVTNHTSREVTESVLWYLTDEVGRLTRPARALAHVEAVRLAPGESRAVRFRVEPLAHLAYPDAGGEPVLEPGRFTLRVGGEAAGFRLAE